ncbi:MAG: aspartate-semialdehyde dehydrogenase [Bryobacterales bacterium]|nr:aspartate-semialdehyde dehydrogenase [Bryobacterales bacterium]
MEKRIDVGVLGATGMVGQQFIRLLENHPWFRLTWLGASDRSAGKRYKEATNWRLDGEMPAGVADLVVRECKPDAETPPIVFSATDASVATEIEQAFANAGHWVISNSRNHRMDLDVPLLVAEINAEHLRVLPTQQRLRGWTGGIVTNPNCSTIGLVMGLAPLRQFGIRKVVVATMQAVSGAGYPGVPSMDILGNVVPYIGGEEEKMQTETQKILGNFDADRIAPMAANVSAHCNRVPAIDGHTVVASVELETKPGVEGLKKAMAEFSGRPQELKLPFAPKQPLVVTDAPDRPQTRRDALAGNGMTVTVGRVRECTVFDYKFTALVHNTIRGAAGAAILNAELLLEEGYVQR